MKKIYFLLTIILIFGCTTNAGLTDNEHGTRFSTTFNRTNDNVYFSSGNACDFALFSAQGAGRNDNNVLRVRNEDPDNFTSSSNYLRLTLPESLPEGGTYRISAWFYVPNEGNENKSTLTGPGIVLNGNYAGSNGIAKFPVNPGTISVNRWTHVDVTLPLAQEPLRTVDFRFVVNSEPNHPSVWYIDDITITQIGGVIALERAEWDLTLPSLCSVYNGKFLIGNAIDYNDLNKDEMKNMYKHHYNAITAGNSMKPDSMWPQRDRQNFTNADNLVNWAEQNGIAVIGHTLVWHSQSSPWLNQVGNTVVTRQQAIENMELYISTVAGRYKGRILSWDVVNEAFYNSVSDVQLASGWRSGLRGADLSSGNSGAPWYRAFANGADAGRGEDGSDYIYYAFVFARIADPNAKLIYNDFNDQEPNKREAIARMTEELNQRWRYDPRYDGRLLIEGIGMQSHYNIPNTNISQVRDSIARFVQTGAKVSITELDITVQSSQGRGYLTPEEDRLQADRYRQLFGYYLEFAEHIERITFWGVADSMSWRAERNPLIFDMRLQAKESFRSIIELGSNAN